MDATSGLGVCLAGALELSGYRGSLLAQTRHSPLQRVPLGASRLLSLSGRRWGFCFRNVLPTHPRHTALADNSSSRAAAARFCFQRSLALPTVLHWGFCSVQISRGRLMSSPWPSHPNYGLQRKTLCVPARTSFICLIIVPLEFESVTGEMFHPSILLIHHIITTTLC